MTVDSYLNYALKCTFKEINNGDIFIFDNNFYIKVDMNACTEHEVNAVCITNFNTTFFSGYTDILYNKDYQTIKICKNL